MFSRRSRQGSGLSTEGVDWGVIEEVVRMVQNRHQIPKETFSTIKKGLKAGTHFAACNSLTLLDSIAVNGGQNIREQLADPTWLEMLLSACYKYPVAAAPICQLLGNWICTYGQEKLGHAAQYAAQALRQKSFYIPVPTALAYHLAKLSQQGTPMIGFQQGTDFASILGAIPTGSRSGSLSSRQGSATSSQPAQAMGGSMGQKVEAMQRGAQQLRELDQRCQSIIDAGPAAAAGVDCKQHSQKGGQLASQCNGWANEVQVMVACEPSDQILAVLLETNDQLLSALTGWDATAQRLVMLQSQQPPAAFNSNHASSSNPASATQKPSSAAAQLPSSSSTSNGSHDCPPAASTSAGGAFWDSLQAQAHQSHGTQPQLLHRPPQLQSQHAAPQRAQDFASSSGRRGNDGQSENSMRQGAIASNSYLDELSGLPASQYPHQKLQSGGDTWQPFGAGPAQPSGPALASHRPQQAAHSQTVNSGPEQQHAGYQGSLLSYALKEQPSRESNEVSDPFAGVEQRQYASPDSPFKAASASQSPFEALPPRQASLSGHSSSFTQQQGMHTDSGLLPGPESLLSEQSSSFNQQQQHTRMDTGMLPGPADSTHSTAGSMQPNTSFTSFDCLRSDASDHNLAATSNQAQAFTGRPAGESQSLHRSASSSNGGAGTLLGADMTGNSLAPATSAAPSGMLHDNTALRSNSASSAEVATLRQQVEQLQAQQAQHQAEVEQMQQQHAAQMAAIQAQAVTKMKELIQKVKQQTVKERQQAELRLEEAHQAEENAVAQLQSLRKDCREKYATIADQQRRLSQQASAATSTPSHDLESTSRTKSSAALDSSPLQQHAFGGIPRPRSASSQLPTLGGSVTRRPVQRAGSHSDKPTASSSVQAYYRQPALRVRFTPGQLEELTQPVSGVSHKDWSAQLKLPPLQ